MQLLALSAEAAFLDQDTEQAGELLCKAAKLGRQVCTHQALAAEIVGSPELSDLFEQSRKQMPEVEKAINALQEARIRHAVPDAPPEAPRRLPFNLRISMLGQEEYVRDGESISSSAWRSAKGRELFLYLL